MRSGRTRNATIQPPYSYCVVPPPRALMGGAGELRQRSLRLAERPRCWLAHTARGHPERPRSFIPSSQRCAPESREWLRQPRRLSLSGVSNGLWSEPLAQQLRHQRRSWACTACKHHAGAGTSTGPQVSPSWIFAANGGFSTSACCFNVSSELPSSCRPDVCCRPFPGAD